MSERHDATTPRLERELIEPSKELDEIAEKVLDAAFKIHRTLGPGLLESIYERCMIYELQMRGLGVQPQVYVPLFYEGLQLEGGLRLDLVVERQLIVEIKAVETLLKVHHAQLKSYLKLTGLHLGLLINFNTALLKEGVKRVILTPE